MHSVLLARWTYNGQFHDERDKVKMNKYVYFHCNCKLKQSYMCWENFFYTTCKFIFMIFGQFSTMRQKK